MSAEDRKDINKLNKILGCYRSKEDGQKLSRKVGSRCLETILSRKLFLMEHWEANRPS